MTTKSAITTIFIAAAATAFAHAANTPARATGTDNYVLAWSDEFNGTALDEDAWNVEVNGDGGGNAELQYYRRENISIETEPESGERCLVLTARRENYNGKAFTSGRLNTHDKVFMTHGKIESRIKLPKTANGLWPAFWMLGNDYQTNPWPRCGEIDILEMGNAGGISAGTQDRYFNGACHWGYYNSQAQYPNYAKSTTNSYSLQDGEFHLFTLVWDEDRIAMYLDLDKNPDAGPYYEMGIDGYDDDWATGNYFHHDFFIVFDLAVGGYFTGILKPNAITALGDGEEKKMYIDYVRVYKAPGDDYVNVPDSYTSDIKGTVADTRSSATRYYSIDGRQLAKAPERGIYIAVENGKAKKYIVRK